MAKQSPSREARSGWGFLLHGRAHPSRFRDAQNGVGASCCGMLLQSAWGEGSEWRRFGARTSCQGLGFRRGLFLAYPVRVPRSCFTHGGPMKIVSYETRAVVVPREPGPPVGGANVAPFVALTLRTDDGIEGIGYAGFVSDVILKSLHECVNAMAELPLAATHGHRGHWQAAARGGRRLAGGDGHAGLGGGGRRAVGHQGEGAGAARPQAAGRLSGPDARLRERVPVAHLRPGSACHDGRAPRG